MRGRKVMSLSAIQSLSLRFPLGGLPRGKKGVFGEANWSVSSLPSAGLRKLLFKRQRTVWLPSVVGAREALQQQRMKFQVDKSFACLSNDVRWSTHVRFISEIHTSSRTHRQDRTDLYLRKKSNLNSFLGSYINILIPVSIIEARLQSLTVWGNSNYDLIRAGACSYIIGDPEGVAEESQQEKKDSEDIAAVSLVPPITTTKQGRQPLESAIRLEGKWPGGLLALTKKKKVYDRQYSMS